MSHFDEQLKQLSELHRDEEMKMRTYYKAKAELYRTENKNGQSKSEAFRKKIGVLLTLLTAIFLAFLITYKWLWESTPIPADETENELDPEYEIIPEEEQDNIEEMEYDYINDLDGEEITDPVREYNVFTDYELDHSGPLGESISFFYSENEENYVLGYGHQAYAVMKYELFKLDETNNRVSIIRRMNDDKHFAEIEAIRSELNWIDKMIQHMITNIEPIDELFFHYSQDITETEITMNGQTYTVYPVETNMEGKTNYFKEGEGLWMKYHGDPITIDYLGEPQEAKRRLD